MVSPRSVIPPLIAAALIAGGIVLMSPAEPTKSGAEPRSDLSPTTNPADETPSGAQVATFGSGCFWCAEAVFRELGGVQQVVSGYSGGKTSGPSYQDVTGGRTGHAEVVQVTYDPTLVDYATLLEVFWKTHDPTTLNRQGADIGTQYRSVIFHHDEEQRRLAEEYKAKLDSSEAFDDPIVTQIVPNEKFYPAEGYHQNYFARNPQQGYCQAVIGPKLAKFREVFGDRLKGAKDREEPASKPSYTEQELRKRLTPEQYRVTQQAGTERPFHNEFWNNQREGEYRCVVCGQHLFESESKFDAHCGWPSFDRPASGAAIDEHEDRTLGRVRTEIRCSRCEAHLGHVFNDGPTETGLRYCLNSAAMQFDEDSGSAKAQE